MRIPGSSKARRQPAPRPDAGFTLIELVVTLAVTALVLSIIPSVLMATTRSTTTSQGIAAGTAQARIAMGNLGAEVGSANLICLPTTLTTNPADPTVAPGFAVRVLSHAYGQDHWVQWAVYGQTLYEQRWPTTWATGAAEPPFVPVALPIVNSTVAPFSLSAAATGSPQVLSIDLLIGATTRGIASQPVEIKSAIAALDTPYAPNPTPQPCATTEP